MLILGTMTLFKIIITIIMTITMMIIIIITIIIIIILPGLEIPGWRPAGYN